MKRIGILLFEASCGGRRKTVSLWNSTIRGGPDRHGRKKFLTVFRDRLLATQTNEPLMPVLRQIDFKAAHKRLGLPIGPGLEARDVSAETSRRPV